MSIPKRNLSRTDCENPQVLSKCALSADKLLLTVGTAGLRALSLHCGQLASWEPTALRDVWRVAFDANTNTLLLLDSQQMLTTCSSYRCVATQASGSKCSASTPVYLIPTQRST